MVSKKSQRKVTRKAIIKTNKAHKKYPDGKFGTTKKQPKSEAIKDHVQAIKNRTSSLKEGKKIRRTEGTIRAGEVFSGTSGWGGFGTHKAPHPKKPKAPPKPKTPKSIGDKKRLVTKTPSTSKIRKGTGRLGGTVTTRKDRGKK